MDEAQRANGHGQEQTQIIPAATAPITKLDPPETVEQRLAKADRQIQYRKGILRLIAANIDPEDIAIYGEGDKETIHLTKTACKQILAWAGITVQPDNAIQEKRYEGVEGPYIDFEVWATWFTPDGRYYRSMGNRSTYDDFFAKRLRYRCAECGSDVRWENRQAVCRKDNKPVRWEKDDYYLPLTEVDIPAVKQAAITNLWNHIVEDSGLKPSKKELTASGFDFSKAGQRVKFGEKQEAKQAPAATTRQAQRDGAAAPHSAAPTPTQRTKAAPSSPQPPQPPKAEIPKEPLGATKVPAQQPLPTEKLQPRPTGDLTISTGTINTAYLNKKRGTEQRFVKLTQSGRELYCWHDSQVVTRDGDKNLLELLVDSRGMEAILITKATTKGGKTYISIEGARRIGDYQWDEDGMPVMEREGAYAARDEDVPF